MRDAKRMFENYNDILTEEDIQAILKISKPDCENLLQQQAIPSFIIAGSRRILKTSLIEYITRQANCFPLCNMVSYPRAANPPMNLDNHNSDLDYTPFQQGVDGMAYKINRAIMIAGQKQWIRANSEQEYADKLTRLVGGSIVPKERHDFKKYALDWFEIYSKPNVATVTAETYQRQINLYLLPAFGDKAIEDITTNDVQALFNGMSGAKTTKDKCKMVLNMIFDMAVDDEIIPKNPLKSKRLKVSGKASEATKCYTVNQMRFIIKNLGMIQNPTDRAYMAIQALHPLRLEEVLGLKWEDVDTENMVLHIHRAVTHPTRNQPEIKPPKTSASNRDIDLHKIALSHLTRGNDSDFVIGGSKPLSYTQVRRMCNRIQKDIGFEEKIVPIRFRTTVLTDIYDQSKDIKLAQAAAGHTTSAMTLKYYVQGRTSGGQVANALEMAYS